MTGQAATRQPPARAPVLADIVLLAAVWVLAVVVVDPRGEFSLNDDWAYAIAVRRLVEEGVFHPPGWVGMTLLSQAVYGALVALVFGFSLTTLRISTLVLGALAVVGTYLLARQLRAARSVALFAALVLAFNPLFFGLSYSFMTEVPFVALLVYTLLFLVRAVQSGSVLAWALATACTLAAVLCRQAGIVLPIGSTAALLLRPPYDRRRLALSTAVMFLAIGVLWGFRLVMEAAGALPAQYGGRPFFILPLLRSNLLAGLWVVLGQVVTAMLYCGLFLLPLLILFEPAWRSVRASRLRWGGLVQLVVVVLSVALLVSWGRRMPLRGNVLIESGIGPVTLHDWYIRGLANDPRLPRAFWLAVTAASVVGTALLVAQFLSAGRRVLFRVSQDPLDAARAVLLCTAIAYLAATSAIVQFDRYFIPLIPILAVALLPPNGTRAAPWTTWMLAGIVLAVSAAYGVAGTRDYLAWNRVRWQALQQLTETDGIEPRRIDGGPEFNGTHFYVDGYQRHVGKSWWWVADDEYMITMGPVPGYEVMRRYEYGRWLPPGMSAITVLRRAGLNATP